MYFFPCAKITVEEFGSSILNDLQHLSTNLFILRASAYSSIMLIDLFYSGFGLSLFLTIKSVWFWSGIFLV